MSEKWTAKKVEEILLLAQDTVSLNTAIGEEGLEGELIDLLEDENSTTPEDVAINADRHDLLLKYMNKYLPRREQDILLMRFGFETEHPMTLEEIGRELGVTRERVRQLEKRAIRRMKVAFHKNKISMENI